MVARKRYTLIILAAVLAVAASFARSEQEEAKGQKEKAPTLREIPSSLEEMLISALRSNPDILVAEADLVQARAKLKQVRLKISHALLEATLQRKLCVSIVESTTTEYERMKIRAAKGMVSSDTLAEARQAVMAAEAAFSETEAMIHALIGIDPSTGKPPESYEQMLTLALRSNGEIALAESDLVRMDARLNQVRLRVTEEVTVTHQMRRVKQNAVAIAKSYQAEMRERVAQGLIRKSYEELEWLQGVIEAEAEVIQIDARIRYLLGLGGAVRSSKKEESGSTSTK